MREDNDRMLRLLCIHEGVPGHYLQLAWSNRSPSLIRTIFGDGMFAEGWACYVEQVLMDVGYGADDPGLEPGPETQRLCQLTRLAYEALVQEDHALAQRRYREILNEFPGDPVASVLVQRGHRPNP